jgi:hypothetical protein
MIKKPFVERWHSDAFDNRSIANQIFIDVKKKLKIIPHPQTGWRSYPNQMLNSISINKNGLRNEEIEILDKNLKNCFLLGGSVAWGFGASSNKKTPSYQIEKILREEFMTKVNIINLADQGYSSIEECNSFLFSFYELKPSMIIILSGINDINFEYNNRYKKIDQYENLINSYLLMDKLDVIKEKNIFKIFLKFLFKSYKKNLKINDEFFYFNKPEKNNIAYSLYQSKIDFIKNFCEQKKIPVYNCLQPDLSFKKNKSNFEKNYINFIEDENNEHISNKLKQFEDSFFKKENDTKYFKNLSLLNCFDNFKETIFIDRTHIADKGNEFMSRRISSFIYENLPKVD